MARKKQLNSDESAAATNAAATKKSSARKAPAAKATAAAKAPKKPLARRTKKTTTQPEAREAQAEVAAANDMAVAQAAPAKAAANGIPWRRIDLHLHTPGSHDYEEPDKTYLDILRQAEKRGLSVIAFTDHNTVNGYRNMLNEIERFEYLEKLGRIHADELWRLNEYRRLMKKILVLPGFEFTATFGFHILGIFPPETPLRDIERVLMDLRVPGPVLDNGLTEAGATSDVLAAYEAIDEAGGIAIAAHANSSNGVSMRGMSLGGQTRIAFTQDPHLYAIEFTDLEKGRHSSAHLFTGIKPEYPRRMFAIQGSDAHRLAVSKENVKRLGVGERPTEVQLENVSFEGLKQLFRSQEFDRVRPVFTVAEVQDDALAVARHTGASATAAFHPALPKRGDRFEAVLRDITAMANGDGGSVFIGCDTGTNKKIAGVPNAPELTHDLASEIAARISPHLSAHIGVNDADGAKVVVIRVPAGTDAPYVFEGANFLVRDGVESRAANRDEIVALARRGFEKTRAQQPPQPHQHQQRQPSDHRRQNQPSGQQSQPQAQAQPQGQAGTQSTQRHDGRRDQRPDNRQDNRRPQQQDRRQQGRGQQTHRGQRGPNGQPSPQSQPQTPPVDVENLAPVAVQPDTAVVAPVANPASANANGAKAQSEPILPGMPRTGVQVTTMEVRNNIEYFTVRDLRNNSIIRNVTKKSARDLWHYAVTQHAEHSGGYDPATIDWAGDTDRAVLSREMRAGKMRSDLAMMAEDGRVLVFYGVTDDGIDDEWKTLIADYEAARAVNVAEPGEDEAEVPIEEFYDEPQPADLKKRNK